AWTSPRITFSGKYYRCEDVLLLPRPLQQPRPPIWVTANMDPESFKWVGEQGYDLMILPWLFPVEQTQARLALYRDSRVAAGYSAPGRVLAMYPAHVADSEAKARAHAEVPWGVWREYALQEVMADAARQPELPERVQRLSYDNMVSQRRAIFGDPQQCAATARWIEETFGVTHLALTFHFGGMDHGAALAAIELWAGEVAPAVRSAPRAG